MGTLRKIKKLIPQQYKNYFHFLIAQVAVFWYLFPARDLKVIGVTGTDGKTTTSTLIYEILKASRKKVALVSTVGAYIGSKEIDTGFHVTAPDPLMLQKLLKKIKDMKYEFVVLEATSHGLDQHRLLGANIKTAVLTNITHEHLDYHKTYDKYVAAKSKIFSNADNVIINKTDSSYKKVKSLIKSSANIISYDYGSTPKKVFKTIRKKFPETYNQLNATAAYLAAKVFSISDKDAIEAIQNFKGITGRMEEIKNNKGVRIIVDFAHTPNALEKVLELLSSQKTKSQRLIAIFGCASERDDKKRPLMGEISARLADISIFTAEDPRYEDVNKIISEMANGAKMAGAREIDVKSLEKNLAISSKHFYIAVPERGEAISMAINKLAKKGDIVVTCGKGHEKSMAYFGVEYPWSDQKAVEMALKGKVVKINHP